MRLGFIVKLKSADDLDLTKKLNFYNIICSFKNYITSNSILQYI